jgi:phosphopantothenoylcysteine decarboxylase/phosphopantothenate--cysteine ligase
MFKKPDTSELGDHDVFTKGNYLNGKRVALIVTGSIAAIKAPFIARTLRRYCADVVAYMTESALDFTTVMSMEWSTNNKVVTELTSASEHLGDNNPFDVYLVAPATSNIINKMAFGIADDAVSTTLASAIGRMEEGGAQVLVAPTMHHTLHTSILDEAMKRLESKGVVIVPPRIENGKHNIPHEMVLVSQVCRAVSDSKLKNKRILVTGGPTPVPIDSVRRITNRFRGRLGINIAEELYMRGANVLLVHGDGAYQPPRHLPYVVAKTYSDYKSILLDNISEKYDIGIFSAGVADYMPKNIQDGKIPSGQELSLELVPTEKIIDLVRKRDPKLLMVTFKYQEGMPHYKLMEIARSRLNPSNAPFSDIVVANRGEEVGKKGKQIAWILKRGMDGMVNPYSVEGKKEISIAIADELEGERRIIRNRDY